MRNELIHTKHLREYVEHRKQSINVCYYYQTQKLPIPSSYTSAMEAFSKMSSFPCFTRSNILKLVGNNKINITSIQYPQPELTNVNT